MEIEDYKEKGIRLFANVVEAELELYNFLHPEFPLTMEDMIKHLEEKKPKETPSA